MALSVLHGKKFCVKLFSKCIIVSKIKAIVKLQLFTRKIELREYRSHVLRGRTLFQASEVTFNNIPTLQDSRAAIFTPKTFDIRSVFTAHMKTKLAGRFINTNQS